MTSRVLLLLVVVVVGLLSSSSAGAVNVAGIRQYALRLPNGHGLSLEVASTEAQRSKGLQGRRLHGGHGMMFVLERGPLPTFHMAQVPAALGIVYVGAAGELLGSRVMAPCSGLTYHDCRLYPTPPGTRIAIELRPQLLRGLRARARVMSPAAVELLVR